jgi:nitrous oxide reductase accessory protein NosL
MFLKLFTILFLFTQIILNADSHKEKKIYPMGKKVFEARCSKDIDLSKYKNIDELKKDIKDKNLCKPLKDKHFDAMALYIWDVKRVGESDTHEHHIDVPKDAKCPVCGMFVYKYPRWAAQMDSLYFDGVKDMMKFYFDSDKDFKKILVSDYYSQKAIDATKAFYVIGSDVYGPMGDELIPFKNLSEAKTFNIDHRGYKILEFSEITKEAVYKLDE